MKLAVHIAYYNDVKDLKFFANSSADEIVEHYKKNYGTIYPVKNGDVYDIDEDFESGDIQLTSDGKYAVQIDLPTNLNELSDDDFCQQYIDIYDVAELDESELDEDEDDEDDEDEDEDEDDDGNERDDDCKLEGTLNKLDWLDNKGFTDDIIDLWEDYMDETSLPYNVYEMEDFDEAFSDMSSKEIMTLSNGNFDPDHKYYAFTEDCQYYISFDKMADYECYMKMKEDFAMFLKKEGYIL